MKKWIISLIFLTFLSGCGQKASKPETKKEPVPKTTKEAIKWVKPDQIHDLYKNPDKYKGYHVKLAGVYDHATGLVNSKKQFDFNMTMDPVHRDTIPTSTYVITDDLSLENKISSVLDDPTKTQAIAVEGVVDGTISDEQALDAFGRPSLKIQATSVKLGDYLEFVSPSLKTLDIKQTKEAFGYKITIEKIEFSPIETRLFATITNNGKQNLKAGSDIFRGKQNNQPIDWISNFTYKGYDAKRLPELVEPGKTVSGIALMDAIDYKQAWILKDNGLSSADYKESLRFEIEIPAVKD